MRKKEINLRIKNHEVRDKIATKLGTKKFIKLAITKITKI